MNSKSNIEIEYCIQCRWMLRASWMCQELLTAFESNISQCSLIPGTGGIFEVRVDGKSVWSLKHERRFPQPKELKQRVRDQVAPELNLGHSDR